MTIALRSFPRTRGRYAYTYPGSRSRSGLFSSTVGGGGGPGGGAPPAAAALGLNTLIKSGTSINTGINTYDATKVWQLYNLLSSTPIVGQAVQNLDGSFTMPGANGAGYNAAVASAVKIGSNIKGWGLTGFYYQLCRMLFPYVLGSNYGADSPSQWSNDRLFLQQAGGGQQQWQGMPSSFNRHIEPDAVEVPGDLANQYSMGMLDWASLTGATISGVTTGSTTSFQISYTAAANPLLVGGTVNFSGASGSWAGATGKITANGGTTGAYTCVTNINSSAFSGTVIGATIKMSLAATPIQPNNRRANTQLTTTWTSGTLLQPANSGGGQGRYEAYVNNTLATPLVGTPYPYRWNYYDPTAPTLPPNSAGAQTMLNYVDQTTQIILFGSRQSGSMPMTIFQFEVWAQNTGALVLYP